MINSHELAWAAGFFDGEGGTYAIKHNTHGGGTLTARVTQKTPDLLCRFTASVGAGKVVRRDAQTWVWYVQGLANVQRTLGHLWPYLGEIKRSQARSAACRWVQFPRERIHISRLSVNQQSSP